MKRPLKFIAVGTPFLLAAALCVQAQTSTQQPSSSSNSSTPSSSSSSSQSTSGTSTLSPSSSSSTQSTPSSSSSTTSPSSSFGSSSASSQPSSSNSSNSNSTSASGSFSGSGSATASGNLSATGNTSSTQSTTAATNTADNTSSSINGTSSSVNGAPSTQQANTFQSGSTQNTVSTSTEIAPQVTTVVQEIDAAGPVVVDRISTRFADVACTPENARMLVEAVHGGTAVTLSADGRSATFTPVGNLGYGDTYVALSLAAEALRNAGVTGCATPDQWKAVLLGGPLSASGTVATVTTTGSSASSTSNFPGILTLHSQGKDWSSVAQTTNVQINNVVSSANSSLSLNSSANTKTEPQLAPTGRTSAEMNQSRSAQGKNDQDTNSLNARSSVSPSTHDKGNDDNQGQNSTTPGKDKDDTHSSSTTQPIDK